MKHEIGVKNTTGTDMLVKCLKCLKEKEGEETKTKHVQERQETSTRETSEMLEREGRRRNQNKECTRETGTFNKKSIQSSNCKSAKRKVCERGKNAEGKRPGIAKTNEM